MQPVRLVKKHAVHLDWYGTVVTTPSLEENKGKASDVRVTACVRNTDDGKQDAYTLALLVKDRLGRVVAECSETKKIKAGEVCAYDLKTPEIKYPELSIFFQET